MKDMIKLVPMELNMAELIGLIIFGTLVTLMVGLLLFFIIWEIIDNIKFTRKYSDRNHRHFPPAP